MKLTPKQRLFVEYYCGKANFNGRLAAELAGYEGEDTTLRVVASENLAKPYMAAAVQEALNERLMSANEVKARLGDIARGTIEPFLTSPDGEKQFHDFTSDAARENLHLLKTLKTKVRTGGPPDMPHLQWTEVETEIGLHDPLRALELLGKSHRLFVDKVEHSGVMTTVAVETELEKLKDMPADELVRLYREAD